jgi:CMP-N,N'-diacetyllegionaminic acid synthase
MIQGKRVLAIVPARSGSKAIPDKNMACIGGLSLIARAATVLDQIPWIDRRIISTDSPRYVDEAVRYGLEAPFMRPTLLSSDTATALDTFVHALQTSEQVDGVRYDLVVVTEPTSPLREPADVEAAVMALLKASADSAVTVSRIDTKAHPHKVFRIEDGRLRFYTERGASITTRQALEPLYSRNGLCYAFKRETLLDKRVLITDNTVSVLTERPVANVDEPLDLLWAEFLLERRFQPTLTPS